MSKTHMQEEIEDFRNLYFETLHKLHRLTEINKTLGETDTMIAELQTNHVVSEQKKTIQKLEKELESKFKENQVLLKQLESVTLMNQEKNSHLNKKLETEIKRNLLTSEQIILLKNQIRLLNKQIQTLGQKYHQKSQIPSNKKLQTDHEETGYINEELKQIIEKLQKEVSIYKKEVRCLQEEIEVCHEKVSKFESELMEMEEFHRLQMESKQSLIQNLERQICKKDAKIDKIQGQLKNFYDSSGKFSLEGQESTFAKDKTISRLEEKVRKYIQMMGSYEQKEQLLHNQLLLKDQIINQLQYQKSQCLSEVNSLREALSGLKMDLIHTELLKQSAFSSSKGKTATPKNSTENILNISRIHKKAEDALNNSRLKDYSKNGLSLSRLNQSGCSIGSICVPYTPINSLNNSRKQIGTKINNIKTGSTKNQSSTSFYKQKKLLLKPSSSITPFQPY